jgi:hypothetical protein
MSQLLMFAQQSQKRQLIAAFAAANLHRAAVNADAKVWKKIATDYQKFEKN